MVQGLMKQYMCHSLKLPSNLAVAAKHWNLDQPQLSGHIQLGFLKLDGYILVVVLE
jgi:hypothetical protein